MRKPVEASTQRRSRLREARARRARGSRARAAPRSARLGPAGRGREVGARDLARRRRRPSRPSLTSQTRSRARSASGNGEGQGDQLLEVHEQQLAAGAQQVSDVEVAVPEPRLVQAAGERGGRAEQRLLRARRRGRAALPPPPSRRLRRASRAPSRAAARRRARPRRAAPPPRCPPPAPAEVPVLARGVRGAPAQALAPRPLQEGVAAVGEPQAQHRARAAALHHAPLRRALRRGRARRAPARARPRGRARRAARAKVRGARPRRLV